MPGLDPGIHERGFTAETLRRAKRGFAWRALRFVSVVSASLW
jgi:hypothetical protein